MDIFPEPSRAHPHSVDEIWFLVQKEAQGEVNRYHAYKELRRDPTWREALDHFLKYDGERYVISRLASS